MVASQLAARGITDRRLLAALARVPREWFLPPHLAEDAYDDAPLPIGSGQTISQPYIVALIDRKSTRLNSSHGYISYAVFCLKKKKEMTAAVTGTQDRAV